MSDWRERGLDPITMEVIKSSVQSLVDEMAYTLGRTCASQLVRDAQDFSTGVCDADGNLISLSITQPSTLGMIPGVLRNIIPVFGASVAPGDVYIVNDPYHGGTHLNDVHIVKPVFAADTLIGYVTTKAHHTDVGGRVPGSMSFDNTEIYQEGLRLPPLRLYARGEPDESLMRVLELNVRYPDVLFADMQAQISSLSAGEAQLIDLATTYGTDQLQAYFAGLLDYGEMMARAQIRTWPDGTAEFEDYCDDDGVTGQPVVIHVKVTVRGEDVFVDFAGSSPQVPAAINFPPFESVSMVHLVVRCCLGGDVPNNGGLFRSVHVSVPEGSILNPRPPAPCSERGLTMYRVGDALMGAFASFVPHGVTAAGEGGSYLMRISGRDRLGRDFLCVDLVQGTWGARNTRDGIDGLANLQANHTNTPIEVVESNFPIRVESHSFVPDTEGPGRFRGGLALERSWRYLGQGEGLFRSRSDRSRFPPYGLFGGGAGAPSHLVLERSGQAPTQLHSKAVFAIQAGDLVRLTLAGGGGWGDSAQRAPEAVANDVREGKISSERARAVYGWEPGTNGATY
jgi:N-methylhydantoinase B